MNRQYIVSEYKCIHCEYTDTLENDLTEVMSGESLFIGLQCESFFDHLAEAHDIHLQIVGLCTISSCIFGVDDPDGELMPAWGGVNLNEHFVQI